MINGAASVPVPPSDKPRPNQRGVSKFSSGGSVRLEGVSKTYKGAGSPAVRPLDLTIEEGEFFSLLGPSGSGKTTLLRLIGGFEFADAGAVFIGDTDVTVVPPHRRPLHTVFQNYALFPHMTVTKNIAYPLKMQRLPAAEVKARVAEMLDRVGLDGFHDRMPNQLSGGQRQRVALARALVGRPEVILLDEPLGALDLRLRQEMQLVLKQLQRDFGITFVYVTHDQGEALAMSDRIAILSDGSMHQIGTPHDVYFRPGTPFVARFVGKSNIVTPPQFAHEVSLRPESIRVGDSTVSCAHRHTARIREVMFQGAFVELDLETGFGDLFAHVPATDGHEKGTVVEIGWRDSDMVEVHDIASVENG